MLKEALEKCECCADGDAGFGFKTMFVMAIATSIDALAVGISLAMAGNVDIWAAIALIGVVTCIMAGLGVKIGSILAASLRKRPRSPAV